MKKKIIIYGIISLFSIGLFICSYVYANRHRSGGGFGGEYLVLLIPFLVWIGANNVKTWIKKTRRMG